MLKKLKLEAKLKQSMWAKFLQEPDKSKILPNGKLKKSNTKLKYENPNTSLKDSVLLSSKSFY